MNRIKNAILTALTGLIGGVICCFIIVGIIGLLMIGFGEVITKLEQLLN